jgi:deoxyribonuclease IV
VFFGGHLSTAGGIDKALDRTEAIGGDAVQVFTQSPRMWRPTNHDPATLAHFRARREELGLLGVVCHAIYLINLASLDDDLYGKSVAALSNTLEVARQIGAEGVVFHVGSHLGAGIDAGLERVVPALKQVLELTDDRTWLLMENSAGAGGTIGRSIGELAQLFDALGRHPRLGVCLDSCHLYVSGIDVTDPVALDATLDELDASIGLDRLRALHVNDSKAELGSNRDRHEDIGVGLMGEGLGVFLASPRLQGLPALLETPGPEGQGPDAAQLTAVRELRERWL